MTINFKPNSDGSAEIQVNAVTRIAISSAGVVTFPSNQVRTWQNVTASRALATTYTNTSSVDIEVVVNVTGVTSATQVSCAATVGGVLLCTINTAESNGASFGGIYGVFHFTVPPGTTYSVASTVGSNTLLRWMELRP